MGFLGDSFCPLMDRKHFLQIADVLFERKVLRHDVGVGRTKRIFGPEREEVAGGWRRLHNEELHNLYASPYIIRVMKSRRMKCAGRVASMSEMKNAHSILVEKRERQRSLGRPRCRWDKYWN
jgi:hypothetical protein